MKTATQFRSIGFYLALIASPLLAVPPGDGPALPLKTSRSPKDLPSDPATDKKLAKLLGADAKIRHTAHYTIAHDTDDDTLNAFITRIEATYASVLKFADRVGAPTRPPTEKLRIIFFDKFEPYGRYMKKAGIEPSQEMPGFFAPGPNRSAFYNYSDADSLKKMKEELASAREAGKAARRSGQAPSVDFTRIKAWEARIDAFQDRINRQVVQHEVAHQVLYNIGLHNQIFATNPRWLLEGLAMMFETPPTAGSSGLGAINQLRLFRWHELSDEKKLPSLRDLVSHSELLLPSNPDVEKAYTQAWALTHYLERTKKSRMAAYIAAIGARTDQRAYSPQEELAEFEKAFGKLDSDFVRKWEAYIRKLPLKKSAAGV